MMNCPCECSQEKLSQMISELQFVCIELNLYIDTHPDDEEAVADYQCYSRKLEATMYKYEELYGPLRNFGHSMFESGEWVRSPWPWQ